MNRTSHHTLIGMALTLTLALVPVARADEVLLAQTTFFSGSESQTVSIDVPSAGVLEVTLTDLAWPDRLASLSFSLSQGAGLLTPAPGSPMLFTITGAEALFGHITAVGGSLGIPGLPDFGLYSLDVSFTPAQAVPLPASVELLAAGLLGLLAAALAGHRRAATGWSARATDGGCASG
jgi:hypothetical protein